MTKKEVLELFRLLKSIYPQFEVDQFKIDTWARLLEGQNFEKVMRKADKHVIEHKFPPAIAELIEFVSPENEFLEKQKAWRREAEKRIKKDKEKGNVRPKPTWL